MTEVVTVRWVTLCRTCHHEHVETQRLEKGIEHAPPPVPRRCEACTQPLRREEYAYTRRFEWVEGPL